MVICYINECVHNDCRRCKKDKKDLVSIGMKTSSEFECGERIRYPICEDFEGVPQDA